MLPASAIRYDGRIAHGVLSDGCTESASGGVTGMSQASPGQTIEGYQAPSVRQFSVFLENRPGKLLDVVQLFEDAPGVTLCGFSVIEASDHAVLRMIPNNADASRKLLREHNLPYSEMDLLVIELGEGHTLSGLCLYLLGAELNIRFAYPLMLRPNGRPTIAVSVDDHILAGQILRRKMFHLLGEADLPGTE